MTMYTLITSMKTKSIVRGQGTQSKTSMKDTRRSVKNLSQKVIVKRTSRKLRASTEKCVIKRTRNKSTKCPQTSLTQKGPSGPSEKDKSGSNKALAACKPKYSIPAKLAEKLNHINKKAMVKTKRIIKSTTNRNKMGNVNKKVAKKLSPNEYFDIWAFVSIGKREASLNASMKVNIMFEKHSPLKSAKKTEKAARGSKQLESMTNKVSGKGQVSMEANAIIKRKKTQSDSVKVVSSHKDKEEETAQGKSSQDRKILVEHSDGKKNVCRAKHGDTEPNKRKCPGNRMCKEEPSAKTRKIETKSPAKRQSKAAKQSRKRLSSGHQMCNIIEKSPRQASLVAKAMIAMGQEDTFCESAARTQIYDWMELRSHTVAESRRIRWCSGLGSSVNKKTIESSGENQQTAKDGETTTIDSDVSGESAQDTASLESESLHSTLLRTLHHIGDSRILKEYLRAQKDDFPGSVDVEKCSTPGTFKKHKSIPDSKKNVPVGDEKLEQMQEKLGQIQEKVVSCSPAKPQPCRVVTPIAQFPVGLRTTSNIASIIHSPIAQPIYAQQQHSHTHTQPIKVTPYPTNPGYIYQYTMDRPQNKASHAPTSQSPMLYGISSSEVAHRDYSSPYMLSHMGRLGPDRRSVNQYQPAAYSTSFHLPVQQIGYNYRTYYPTAIHAIPQQTIPALPVHSQYPSVQAPVVMQRQINQDLGQRGSYQHSYSPYPPVASVVHNEGCMPPPLPPAHRRTPMELSPPMRQQPVSVHSSLFAPLESLRSLTSVGVQQPIASSPALDFSPEFPHHQSNHHKQFPSLPSYRPHHRQFINQSCKGSTNFVSNFSVTCNELNQSFPLCKKEQEDILVSSCDLLTKSSMCSSEGLSQSSSSSRTNSECSDVSDLLHSAHTTMYQTDGVSSVGDNLGEFQQAQISVACDSGLGIVSPFKMSVSGHTSFSTSYSVSSILDMPSCKVKVESENKSSPISQTSNLLSITDQKTLEQPVTCHSTFVCLASVGSSDGSNSKESHHATSNNIFQKSDRSDQSIHIKQTVKHEDRPGHSNEKSCIIIIGDTDESSDDEPLARLVKPKSADNLDSQSSEVVATDIHISDIKPYNPHLSPEVVTADIHTSDVKPYNPHLSPEVVATDIHTSDVKPSNPHLSLDVVATDIHISDVKPSNPHLSPEVVVTDIHTSDIKSSNPHLSPEVVTADIHISDVKPSNPHLPPKVVATDIHISDAKPSNPLFLTQHSAIKAKDKIKLDSAVADKTKVTPGSLDCDNSQSLKVHSSINTKYISLKPESDNISKATSTCSQNSIIGDQPPADRETKISLPRKTLFDSNPKAKKPANKTKAQPECHLTSHEANANHGWSWIGEGQIKPIPKVSPGREEAVRIRKRYQSMQHTSGEMVSVRDCVILHSDGDGKVPYVAKVSALWENLNGEMMFSMLWYYQPEHTAAGREPDDGDQELFASKHREENSVACIDDKCFVLMYNEYCRLEAEGVRLEQGVVLPRWRELIPEVTADGKELRRLPPPANVCVDNIWFCRYDYDFRKKVVKKPKQKKCNLRYRVPSKAI